MILLKNFANALKAKNKLIEKALKYNNLTVVGISLIFIIINAAIIYYLGVNYFSFFPFVLLVGVIALFSYDKIFYLIAFLTPLSLTLTEFVPEISFNFSIFTEPLLILLLFILTFKFLYYRQIEIKVIKHPITIAIIFMLLWIFVTSLTSTLKVISFKFFLAKLWLIIPIFFFGLVLFKNYKNIKPFIWAYSISLLIIVTYSTIKLSQSSLLDNNAAHFVVQPFYNDHTAYGAIVALMAPVFWGLAFKSKYKPQIKIIASFFAIAFTIATLLSYSRASWIGLIAALMVWVIVKLKIKFRFILLVSVLLAAFLAAFWFQIIDRLEKNQQDSSSKLSKHISSITNITTDASNVERLNRWFCAIEMFKEKPITGWGPGTYQFQYAPFQLERMRTIISTNFGDVGNAHSEYLGPLAEQGVFGSLAFLWLAIAILITGFKLYRKAHDKEIKTLSLSITLSFITYFIHAFLNNFLHSDKLAVPFFGFASILVALDIYHTKKTEKK